MEIEKRKLLSDYVKTTTYRYIIHMYLKYCSYLSVRFVRPFNRYRL